MKLAREGWEICGVATVVTVAGTFFLGGYSLPLWVLWAIIVQFFREPNRVINADPDTVLSPADGRIVYIGKAPAPVEGAAETLKISVFMNVFNVHANRAPLGGTVSHSQRFAGKFFNAALDKASAENERHLIGLKTPHGEVFVMQIAGLLARRVLCYATIGDRLSAGERYGFIRFGSRVDVFLPPDYRPLVMPGDKVKAGLDRIARAPSDD